MTIASHIARSLAPVLTAEKGQFNLFFIRGMPGVGKTTLVKSVFTDLSYVDLQDIYPQNLARTQPKDFFGVYGKRLIVDSIQYCPDLLDYLPADESAYIVLVGYVPQEKLNALREKRTVCIRLLTPFSQREYSGRKAEALGVEPAPIRITYPKPGFFDLIRNGFLPRSDLSLSTGAFYESWLGEFFSRHVREVLHAYKDTLFFNYLKVLARHNMQELNHSKFAKEAGISYATAIYWTDFLVDCGVLIDVPSLNLSERRQVKRSKIAFADTGLLCFLLGISSGDAVFASDAYPEILSGFAAAEIVKNYASLGQTAPLFFYRDTARKHVELVLQTPRGTLPLAFLSKKSRSFKESIRHGAVLIKIASPCEDMVFISDGTQTLDSTAYPILSASLI